jgi:hypothetical protein
MQAGLQVPYYTAVGNQQHTYTSPELSNASTQLITDSTTKLQSAPRPRQIAPDQNARKVKG